MSFVLLRSSSFIRSARKVVKKQPELAISIQQTLTALKQDPFQSQLKTHKLKGDLKNSYACSVGYDLRIVFKFVQHQQQQAILLEAIGSHEEVY